MNKPLLVIVTGAPASGKTTLASILSAKINCPLVSRDQLKEGFLNTVNLSYKTPDKSVDLHIYEVFFETINFLISRQVTVVAEAAFQDKLWRPQLLPLLEKASIKIIVCNTDTELSKQRFIERLSNNIDREKYHGDNSEVLLKGRLSEIIENYKAPQLDIPTIQVDTSFKYSPTIEEIIKWIFSDTNLLC